MNVYPVLAKRFLGAIPFRMRIAAQLNLSFFSHQLIPTQILEIGVAA
jgi:hypothetical protein